MCDSHLQASHSHLQNFHSHLQVLSSGSSNTKLYDLNLLDTGFYVIRRPQGSHRTLTSLGILHVFRPYDKRGGGLGG